MALTKKDETIIKDITQASIKDEMKPLSDIVLILKTVIFGEGGSKGMVGKQKEHDDKIDGLEKAVVVVSKSVVKIESVLSSMKWIIGILATAILGGIIALIVKLLTHSG